jgi:hypothetical protein
MNCIFFTYFLSISSFGPFSRLVNFCKFRSSYGKSTMFFHKGLKGGVHFRSFCGFFSFSEFFACSFIKDNFFFNFHLFFNPFSCGGVFSADSFHDFSYNYLFIIIKKFKVKFSIIAWFKIFLFFFFFFFIYFSHHLNMVSYTVFDKFVT